MIEANTCHWALPCTYKSVRMPGGPRTERCLWQLTRTVAQRCDAIWTKGRGERSCPHNFKKRKHFNCKIQTMIIHRIRHKQQTLAGKFASHADTKDGDTYIWTHILGMNKWVNKLEALGVRFSTGDEVIYNTYKYINMLTGAVGCCAHSVSYIWTLRRARIRDTQQP